MDMFYEFSKICLHKFILFNEGDLILMFLNLQSLSNSNDANILHLVVVMEFQAMQLLLKYN